MITLYSQTELETRLVSKLNSTTFLAYALVRDDGLVIDQTSPNFCSFIGYPNEDVRGLTVTDVFVEFIGAEDAIAQVMCGAEDVFRLEYVARERTDGETRYYTIEVISYDGESDAVLLLLLDTTVAGRLQQRLTQERNELAHEVQRHEITQIQLREARDELSQRVIERTAELARTNAALRQQIEERKQVEAELLHVQKMEAIGELAGGVAHDFNNWLTVINTYSELLMQRDCDEEMVRRYAGHVNEAGKQAHALTSQLLTFSRKQVAQPLILNVNASIESVSSMVERVIGKNINVKTVLNPDLEAVRIDPGQLHQILMNLVFNARDAMLDGGDLTISTFNVSADQLQLTPDEQDDFADGAVVLRIADSGHGMTEAVRARIFDPFFTTKEIGKGTGLGLSTVYGIVKQSGGTIQVESILGKGTAFDICLPVVKATLGKAKQGQKRPPEMEQNGNAFVLVVDDEPMIRELVQECLESIGYRVVTAVDGPHALEIANESEQPIDLLLTDVMMPKVNGKQLAEQMSLDHSETLRVLYMSGYSSEVITQQDIAVEEVSLLKKPFTANELLSAVYDILSLSVVE